MKLLKLFRKIKGSTLIFAYPFGYNSYDELDWREKWQVLFTPRKIFLMQTLKRA